MTSTRIIPVIIALSCAAACTVGEEGGAPVASEDAFSSARARLLDFAFEGELLADSAFDPTASIKNQLLFTVGQLNGEKYERRTGGGVGRLDAVQLTDIATSPAPGGKTRITYRAVLPVGWLDVHNAPKSYQLKLPRDVSYSGLEGFTRKYSARCVDTFSAHDVSSGNYWYYYRPTARGCAFAAEDIVTPIATVTPASTNTNGTYPEYDRIWSDGVLRAIVIFGKDNASGNSFSDFGVSAFGQFNAKLRWGLPVRVEPVRCAGRPGDSCEGMPAAPGVEFPDVTWAGTFADGRKVEVIAMLINAPTSTTAAFDRRYADLTPGADFIVYNGHAALGANVRALSRKGRFVPGQYTIVSMMGCDSFAYVDGHMAQERARLNPDDPTGTKYLDMVTNVMPTNPTKLPPAAISFISALADTSRPRTYQQILGEFEFDHFAVVTGDEDNAFRP